MASTTEIEDFLAGPLVSWLCSCLDSPERTIEYDDLVDGILLHQVLLQIDPEPMHRGIVPSLGNATIRVKNLGIIIKNIKNLYEEELCQVLLVMPDCVTLGNEPESKAGIENMQLLLLLLLGCAVQCPNKKGFIEGIKQMNVDEQHSIVDCIKQVTDSHQIVLTRDLSEAFSTDLMVTHIRRLVKERDDYLQHWAGTVTKERLDSIETQRKMSAQILGGGGNQHHLAVELADWKSRLRKQRQEFEEKSEALAECREELELNKVIMAKLRQDVQEQMQDARSAKAYRDELDAVRERAERVDKLEAEVQRYREKLSDIEFYKTRVEELREDNKVLLDTREMLEEQLQRARKRGDHVLDLESELLKFKQHVNELTLDREADQEKLQELFEENAQLQLVAKSAVSGHSSLVDIGDNADKLGGDNSLSEQMSSNAEARALKLELENRRLLSMIDNLKEERFHDSSIKILELEKDKKKMSIKVDQLQDTSHRMTQQNLELEKMFKSAMEENGKLHDAMDSLKANGDRLENEVHVARSKVEELETSVECSLKDKQRLQLLLEGLQRRLEEQERAALQAESWKTEAMQVPELKSQHNAANAKIEVLEKENQTAQRELTKLKEAVEVKDMALDRCFTDARTQEEETSRLMTELDTLSTQIVKLQEVERESQELVSRAAVDKETLVTLQSDLVAQKLNNEQYKRILEKLGLNLEELLDPDMALDRIASSPEVLRMVRELISKEESLKVEPPSDAAITPEFDAPLLTTQECETLSRQCDELRFEVSTLQTLTDSLRSENANLQVNVAMLQSQISSLSSQHLALQLANSQLAVEKDELSKERNQQQLAQEQLLIDQVTLQALHEQLNTEYEILLVEREGTKTMLRDTKSELRTFRELCTRQEATQEILEQEKEHLKVESRSLANLRAEHSSLKDDFRNLFTASEKLKTEYRSLQEEYRTLRGENGSLKLRHTEMQGEMASRGDRTTMLEVELSKVNNRCEMLSQMNSGLEDDRRSLMEHVSLLLTQYHELLTHSLEDKEHYHTEEKLFTDKVNNLCRQKEKLEEKIMEHYRKLDSCSTKKKSFGATLVKRVRKAGSDLINKVPRSRRSSWLEDSQTDSQRATSQVTLSHGSESGGNESDTSNDDHLKRDSFARSSISLGSTGTRRAVYFTEEENEEARESIQDSTTMIDNKTLPSASTPLQENKPFLVYNRISIGANESSQMTRDAPSPSLSSHSLSKLQQPEDGKQKGKGKGENSIWYEYGCV